MKFPPSFFYLLLTVPPAFLRLSLSCINPVPYFLAPTASSLSKILCVPTRRFPTACQAREKPYSRSQRSEELDDVRQMPKWKRTRRNYYVSTTWKRSCINFYLPTSSSRSSIYLFKFVRSQFLIFHRKSTIFPPPPLLSSFRTKLEAFIEFNLER